MFQAKNVQKADFTLNEKVVFTTVTTNEGSGYNSSTGRFTAPVAGLYAFAKQICTHRTKSALTTFMLNDIRVLDSQTTASLDENACASGQVFVQMNKGDQMWVAVKWDVTHILSETVHQSNFAGAFIHP